MSLYLLVLPAQLKLYIIMPAQLSHLFIYASVTLTILVLGYSKVHSQTWQRLGPDLHDVEWITANTIIAVGEFGSILRSEDAGESWQYIQTGISDNLYTLCSFDSVHALVAGENGKVFATYNAGTIWKQLDFPFANEHIHTLEFPNSSDTGLAVAYSGTVFLSTDRGATWKIQGNVGTVILDVSFLKDSICIAASDESKLYRSTDFGKTWSMVYETDTLTAFHQIAIHKNTTVVVGQQRSKGYILKSTNQGVTWQEITPSALDFQPYSVHFIDGQRIIIAGQRPSSSDILLQRAIYSENGGETWEVRKINEERGFLIIKAFSSSPNNPDRGIAIGTHQGIYLTQDGGNSWTTRSYARMYEPDKAQGFQSWIYGSCFYDWDTGIAYGADGFDFGYALRTTDRGTTWHSIPSRAIPRGILLFKDGTGIGIPASSPTLNIEHKLIDIADYGTSWEFNKKEFDSTYRYYFTSPPAQVTDEVLSFTADSVIFESNDQGESWKRVTTIPEALAFNHMQYRSKYGWVSVKHNTQSSNFEKVSVLRCSINDRTSWNVIYQDTGSSFDIQVGGLWFLDDKIGFLGNRKGVLYKTTNSGDTWDSIAQFETGITAIRFFGDSIGLVVGGMIMYTSDAGQSWERIEPWPERSNDLNTGFIDIQLLPDERTVILTGIGIIARGVFPDKLTSVKDNVRTERPYSGVSITTAIPNPVKRGEELRLRLRDAGTNQQPCSYMIYDVQGKLLTEHHNVPLKAIATESEMSINTAALPAGLYFVSIETKTHRIVKSRFIVVE